MEIVEEQTTTRRRNVKGDAGPSVSSISLTNSSSSGSSSVQLEVISDKEQKDDIEAQMDSLSLSQPLNQGEANKIFKSIYSFVEELDSQFGKDQHSLQLYYRFLTTKVQNLEDKKTQIDLFTKFLLSNKEAIQSKDYSLLENDVIRFSEKLNIKIAEIFKLADESTRKIIWSHIFVINAMILKDENSITLFTNDINSKKDDESEEENMIKTIFDTIGNSVGDSSASMDNPMGVIMGLLGNGQMKGLLSNMNSKLNSGELDVEKMFGSVQAMLKDIKR